MKVGLSINTDGDRSVWSAGMWQNVAFLARCLRAIPFVGEVVLINAGGEGQTPREFAACIDVALMSPADVTGRVDVVVEMAGALDPAWLAHVRARGARVVFHAIGQPYVGLVEPQVFGQNGFFGLAERCDRVWLLEKDRAHLPMMRTIHRCAVEVAPYLWAPDFLQKRIQELRLQGAHFGWRKEAHAPARIAVIEPNISVVKNCVIPMLICDKAYRESPASIAAMMVLNATHMVHHPTLLHLANSLDIVKQHKATFDGRFDIAAVMSTSADIVVSHQWCNDQNYAYLDVLYGDYPLIHNSPWLGDVGYYYPDFDAHAGADQLLRAVREHDQRITVQRGAARQLFERLAPDAPANVAAYARLLLDLWDGRLPARMRA